jgi:hypothetical protein
LVLSTRRDQQDERWRSGKGFAACIGQYRPTIFYYYRGIAMGTNRVPACCPLTGSCEPCRILEPPAFPRTLVDGLGSISPSPGRRNAAGVFPKDRCDGRCCYIWSAEVAVLLATASPCEPVRGSSPLSPPVLAISSSNCLDVDARPNDRKWPWEPVAGCRFGDDRQLAGLASGFWPT